MPASPAPASSWRPLWPGWCRSGQTASHSCQIAENIPLKYSMLKCVGTVYRMIFNKLCHECMNKIKYFERTVSCHHAVLVYLLLYGAAGPVRLLQQGPRLLQSILQHYTVKLHSVGYFYCGITNVYCKHIFFYELWVEMPLNSSKNSVKSATTF